jgi:hypothetical protein
VTDTDGDSSGWHAFDDTITVQNNMPWLSKRHETSDVFRNQSTELRFGFSDTEDTAALLLVQVEYSSPSGNWSTIYLSDPEFSAGLWKSTFSPLPPAELGEYDIRVRVTDTDGNTSSWYVFNDNLTVLNNYPLITDYYVSDEQVLPTETSVISIETEDVEDPVNEHDLSVEYRPSSGVWPWDTQYLSELTYNGTTDRWDVEFTPSNWAEQGYYDIRIMLYDTDNDTTGWIIFNDVLRVINNRPLIMGYDISSDEVLRTDSVTLRVAVYDIEDADTNLSLNFEYRAPGGDWESNYISEAQYNSEAQLWETDMTPETTAVLGLYDIRVNVIDRDNTTSDWYTYAANLTVWNNIPTVYAYEPGYSELYRMNHTYLYLGVADVEDSKEELVAEIYYRTDNGTWEAGFITLLDYDDATEFWRFNFTPLQNALKGTYDVRARVLDRDMDYSPFAYYNQSVVVFNNIPVVTSAIPSQTLATEGTKVWFNASSQDDREVTTHEWLSHRDGLLGSSESIVLDTLTNGTHNITYRVQDDDGDWSLYYNFSMRVNGIPLVTSVASSSNLLNEFETFEFTSTVHDDVGIVLYEWIADGSELIGYEQDITFASLANGTHTVGLRVQDTDGIWSDIIETTVRVNGIPFASTNSVTSKIVDDWPPYTVATLEGTGSDNRQVIACEWKYSDTVIDATVEPSGFNSGNESFISHDCAIYSVANISIGYHIFSLRVQDDDGVWSDWSDSELFYVDDGDGVIHALDAFPFDSTQWDDRDQDGCGDNLQGTMADIFPDDPSECLDTDGDGIGDNSDWFVNIPNNYVYISSFVVISLLVAMVLEYSARASVGVTIGRLEGLRSSGIENERVKTVLEELSDPSGSRFLSPSLRNAKSLLNEYAVKNETILRIMEELHVLRSEATGLSTRGAEIDDLIGEVSELESQLIQEAEADASIKYLEKIQKQFVERVAKGNDK